MKHGSALITFPLESGVGIAQAKPWHSAPVTLESPALSVMTDLTQVKAATTHPETTLSQAEQMMIYLGVRMLIVVSDMPAIEGLITNTDLHGDRQMKLVHERGLRYDELTVGDVMSGLTLLDAIDFDAVGKADVGNLIATLQRVGRNHLLVVQAATVDTPRRVRGVISRAQIERQLGMPVHVAPIANSFSEIKRALA